MCTHTHVHTPQPVYVLRMVTFMVKLHGKPNEGNAIFLEFSAHILIGKWEVSKCIKAYTSAYIKRDLIQASLKFSLKGWSFTSTWPK